MLAAAGSRRTQAVLALAAAGLGCAAAAAARAATTAAYSGAAVAAQFAADGFVSPVRVLSLDEAAEALAALRAWAAERLPDGEVSGDLRFKPHLHLPFVSRLVRHPAILDVVSAALGTENLLLWSSDFNIKPPMSGGFFSAHQDATFTGLAPADRGVTVCECAYFFAHAACVCLPPSADAIDAMHDCWPGLALSDPVDEESGCMVFWPGSHRRGQLPHLEEPSRDANNMLSRGQRVDVGEGEAYSELAAELRAGEASLHHLHLVHRSAPNRSDRPRVGEPPAIYLHSRRPFARAA